MSKLMEFFDWESWGGGSVIEYAAFVWCVGKPTTLVVDGRTYLVGDGSYCIEPGCSCEEVSVTVALIAEEEDAITDVGSVSVVPSNMAGAQFHAHGANRALVQQVWAAWCASAPAAALMLERQAAVREIAPEFHARWVGRQNPLKLVR